MSQNLFAFRKPKREQNLVVDYCSDWSTEVISDITFMNFLCVCVCVCVCLFVVRHVGGDGRGAVGDLLYKPQPVRSVGRPGCAGGAETSRPVPQQQAHTPAAGRYRCVTGRYVVVLVIPRG